MEAATPARERERERESTETKTNKQTLVHPTLFKQHVPENDLSKHAYFTAITSTFCSITKLAPGCPHFSLRPTSGVPLFLSADSDSSIASPPSDEHTFCGSVLTVTYGLRHSEIIVIGGVCLAGPQTYAPPPPPRATAQGFFTLFASA